MLVKYLFFYYIFHFLGQKFAILEIKTALIYLVKAFEILPVPGFEPLLMAGPLLGSENGLKIKINKRM